MNEQRGECITYLKYIIITFGTTVHTCILHFTKAIAIPGNQRANTEKVKIVTCLCRQGGKAVDKLRWTKTAMSDLEVVGLNPFVELIRIRIFN